MIFVNELIKAFCKRTTIAIFAVLLLLNGVLLYINETKQTLEYTPEQYKCCSPRKIRKTQKCGITRN
ncbi:MAG: hypothetical protein U0K24_08860 [Lachnospiraceae bacterium]|nr:hypothetical protein [Lachnospiraceae bacterium]